MNQLTILANKYKTDKGTVFKCAHGYTVKYDQLFKHYLLKNNPISILEIGLNRIDNETFDIPSLKMLMNILW